jgi:hypothetical protein
MASFPASRCARASCSRPLSMLLRLGEPPREQVGLGEAHHLAGVVHHAARRHRLVDRLLHQGDAGVHLGGEGVRVAENGGDVGEPRRELPHPAEVEARLQVLHGAIQIALVGVQRACGVVCDHARERLVGLPRDAEALGGLGGALLELPEADQR